MKHTYAVIRKLVPRLLTNPSLTTTFVLPTELLKYGSGVINNYKGCLNRLLSSTCTHTNPRQFYFGSKTNGSKPSPPVDVGKDDYLYQAAADRLLEHVFDCIEDANLEILEELDLKDGVLTIQFGEPINGSFVLNRHYIHKQIWYSSPVSGPHYFEFDSEPRWTSSRTGKSLYEQLQDDICGKEAGLNFKE